MDNLCFWNGSSYIFKIFSISIYVLHLRDESSGGGEFALP